jgi:hypothetical protein
MMKHIRSTGRSMRGRTGLVLLAVTLAQAGTGSAHHVPASQTPPIIRGIVTDSSGRPIAYAQVRGPGVDPRMSDDSGRFRFSMRKAGPLAFEVKRLGFRPLQVKLSIGADTTLDLVMSPVTVSLATVRVEAEATVDILEFRGFYGRLRDHVKGTNTGYFVMPEEIEGRRGANKVTQLLQGIPNLRVLKIIRGGGSFDTFVGPGGCPMTIYVDGQRLNGLGGGMLQPVDLEWVPTTRELAGVEVYTRANAPGQFQQFALNCGVVLLWTK